MNDVMLSLVAVEAGSACRGEPDLIERIKKAMRAARDHWMVLDPEIQLRGALAAVLQESEGAERERLERSIERLKKASALLSALASGVPVDFEAVELPSDEDNAGTIPILKLWEAEGKPHA